MEQGSFKDFESVRLKATYNMKIGDREIVPGETIAFFDKIQIAGLNEVVSRVAARGGFDNRAHVYWETTQEIQLRFAQGVFSKDQLALMANSRLLSTTEDEVLDLTFRERLESDENGKIYCKYVPAHNIFVYDAVTGEKLSFTQDEDVLTIEDEYKEVIVDYQFEYENGVTSVYIGRQLIQGFVELEGLTRVKDDVTGHIVTGLVRIPKLRVMSDLSIRLGAQANPIVGSFNGVGVPVGSKGYATYVMEFHYLSDDVESDL